MSWDDILYTVIAVAVAVAIGVVGWLVFKSVRTSKAWRGGLQLLVNRLELRHVKPEGRGPALLEHAQGEVEGHQITVHVVEEEVEGSDRPQRQMVVGIAGPYRSGIRIGKRGSLADLGYADPGADLRVPTGDAQFDQLVEIRGASPHELGTLRADPGLRRVIYFHVRGGGTLDGNSLEFKSRKLPGSAHELVHRVEQLLELARYLTSIPR
jgi:hypothetical protein